MDIQSNLETLYEVSESGCWEWLGSKGFEGYGSYKGKPAHRVMYQLHRGEIPEGLVIDHLCVNKGCVNPEHLEAVTKAENSRRGRHGKPKVQTMYLSMDEQNNPSAPVSVLQESQVGVAQRHGKARQSNGGWEPIKIERIAFRINEDLYKSLDLLAAYLNRTRSDTVRILLEKAIRRERERV